MPRRNRKMKGGFLDSLGTTLEGWGSSIKQTASTALSKTKNAVTGSTDSMGSTAPITTVGGRTRKHKRGGSYSAHKSVTGLAANSASVSNMKTAQPHNMVGGKSRRHRKHKHSKSCKHMKH
jgi:hypothetical protein